MKETREILEKLEFRYSIGTIAKAQVEGRPYLTIDQAEAALDALIAEKVAEALDTFEHRIDCDTVISELYGWKDIVSMAKEETKRIIGITPPAEQSKEDV